VTVAKSRSHGLPDVTTEVYGSKLAYTFDGTKYAERVVKQGEPAKSASGE
jgi:hypothetical protein